VVSLPHELLEKFKQIEKEAYSHLVAGDFSQAEQIYKQQYEILRSEEQKLSSGDKYHKGGPLHNWGISLLLQNRILEGFQKIALAYIEDLLDSPAVDDALNAPAFKTLQSYPLISREFLNQLKKLAAIRKEQSRVPRDPEEVMNEYRTTGHADLASTFTVEGLKTNPITIEQLRPQVEEQLKEIGPKEKRVFIGGCYKNIAVLRYIAYQIVENIDDFKAVLPIDLPSLSAKPYDHLVHDLSMEYLKNCSWAIFEVSVSNGHLMEIERAYDIKKKEGLKVILVFQKTKPEDEPYVTRMIMTTDFEKKGYRNFTELITKVGDFLKPKRN
jgi:hypothetical protein